MEAKWSLVAFGAPQTKRSSHVFTAGTPTHFHSVSRSNNCCVCTQIIKFQRQTIKNVILELETFESIRSLWQAKGNGRREKAESICEPHRIRCECPKIGLRTFDIAGFLLQELTSLKIGATTILGSSGRSTYHRLLGELTYRMIQPESEIGWSTLKLIA